MNCKCDNKDLEKKIKELEEKIQSNQLVIEWLEEQVLELTSKPNEKEIEFEMDF